MNAASDDPDHAWNVQNAYGNAAAKWQGPPAATSPNYSNSFPLLDPTGATAHSWPSTDSGNTGYDSGGPGLKAEMSMAYTLRSNYVVRGNLYVVRRTYRDRRLGNIAQ